VLDALRQAGLDVPRRIGLLTTMGGRIALDRSMISAGFVLHNGFFQQLLDLFSLSLMLYKVVIVHFTLREKFPLTFL
jgi:hypothetical protein